MLRFSPTQVGTFSLILALSDDNVEEPLTNTQRLSVVVYDPKTNYEESQSTQEEGEETGSDLNVVDIEENSKVPSIKHSQYYKPYLGVRIEEITQSGLMTIKFEE